MTAYTLQDLLYAKGTTEPVRQIMLSLSEQNDALRQQLAAAQAAIKVKDKALVAQIEVTSWEDQDKANDLSAEALDIQPDDSALKAWLGEPVAWATVDLDEISDHQSGYFSVPLYGGLNEHIRT